MHTSSNRVTSRNLRKVSAGFMFLDCKETVYLIAVFNSACKEAAEKQPLDMWQEFNAIRADIISLAEENGIILKGSQTMVVITYQMKCTHKQSIDMASIKRFMLCQTCKRQTIVTAVECREWKYKCEQPGCRVARFCGQSYELAQEKALGHYHNTNHLVQTVDYTRVEWKVKRVQTMLGKGVKVYIISPEHDNKVEGEARRYENTIAALDEGIPF